MEQLHTDQRCPQEQPEEHRRPFPAQRHDRGQRRQRFGQEGDLDRIQVVEYVDQNSIGKSSRSNPVTYIGAYDEIRKLYAEQPLAKQMGYTAAYFSFNKEGGRCEECKGEGKITVEMQFMADITQAGGARYRIPGH